MDQHGGPVGYDVDVALPDYIAVPQLHPEKMKPM